MKKIALFLALTTTPVQAETYHWACRDTNQRRYVVQIDTTLELIAREPTTEPEVFTLKGSADPDQCAKAGWTAEDDNYDVVFCVATQGYGTLKLTPKKGAPVAFSADSDNADIVN